MLVIAHHGLEPLLPAVLGVSALAVHYLRAWVRVGRPRRPTRRGDAGAEDRIA